MNYGFLDWNGSTWTNVPGPVFFFLSDLAMLSTTDGWIVGPQATLHYEAIDLDKIIYILFIDQRYVLFMGDRLR
jgi:hypothetical protein